MPVGHALLEDGEEAGAGGEEGDPLRDDDGEEEPGVARVLQRLAVLVRPLLREEDGALKRLSQQNQGMSGFQCKSIQMGLT